MNYLSRWKKWLPLPDSRRTPNYNRGAEGPQKRYWKAYEPQQGHTQPQQLHLCKKRINQQVQGKSPTLANCQLPVSDYQCRCHHNYSAHWHLGWQRILQSRGQSFNYHWGCLVNTIGRETGSRFHTHPRNIWNGIRTYPGSETRHRPHHKTSHWQQPP